MSQPTYVPLVDNSDQTNYANTNPNQPETIVVDPSFPMENPQPSQPTTGMPNNLALILFICGFCAGIIWIVNYFLFRSSPNNNERKYANWSLYALCIYLILGFVTSIFYFLVV